MSYPRGYLVSVFSALWTGFMSIIVVSAALLVRRRRIIDFLINYAWCGTILRAANVNVEVRGVDSVKDDKLGCLILFNHSSHMDIPVLCLGFPRSFRFGAKIELFRFPLFGRAMRICGVLPIDRANRTKVMQIYEEAIARVRKGECFALAPEGTRQPEPKLGPFKRGPFEFAINAGMDIVPVVMAGCYAVMPKRSLWINQGRWSRTVIMQITPRVPASEYSIERIQELMDRVRAQMVPVHDRLYAELGPQGL